jgi:hypothetical protein
MKSSSCETLWQVGLQGDEHDDDGVGKHQAAPVLLRAAGLGPRAVWQSWILSWWGVHISEP